MAQGLLTDKLSKTGQKSSVYSAGLNALVGQAPDKNARILLSEKGIRIDDFTASQIDRETIRKMDLILVMEMYQKKSIEIIEPSAKGKVFRLGEWGDFDIKDPYQQNLATFRHCLKQIEQGVNDWMTKLVVN